jgi:hypothetical protein
MAGFGWRGLKYTKGSRIVSFVRKANAKPKPINLPSSRKIKIDIGHIKSGHTEGGLRVSDKKDLFPKNMTDKQIEKAVREAYRKGEKVYTQGDRVFMRGESGSLKIEMWVNKTTKTIESAWPFH